MTPEELKKQREKLGLSQCELGENLDRKERFIQYRESGDIPIDKMLKHAVTGLSVTLKKKRKKHR